jgi:7-dehydrocholesterol reductase
MAPTKNIQVKQEEDLDASSAAPKSGDWSAGKGSLPGREFFGPLFLMLSTPPFSICFYHVCTHMDGNFAAFFKLILSNGLLSTLYSIWPTPFDVSVWKMILSFMAFELILQKYMPGKEFKATVTPQGNIPIYKANGMQSYVTTLVTLLGLTYFELFRPAVVYEKFGEILSSMNLFALLFCAMLLVKSYVAPTNSDVVSSGNIVADYYVGRELHPRIFGWDVKQFTNCRFGMMYWAVGILCYAHKNIELNNGIIQLGMAVNVALQLVYISKFFYWEMGYMNSMDIQHDKAGFYICWGCLVWVPSVYTSHSFYLTENAPDISVLTALAIFTFGFLCIWINYDSDNQRYVFRQTNGECLIFGKQPRYLVAEYATASGEIRKNLLLLDGWWKISRHFHYMPEILASLCWGLPALNTSFIGPYFYTTFLTILLFDRAVRDDNRCAAKYGPFWTTYKKEVPYLIIPFVY